MSSKKQARARYAQIAAQLAASKGWFASPAQSEKLKSELRALAEVLFGPAAQPVAVKVRK